MISVQLCFENSLLCDPRISHSFESTSYSRASSISHSSSIQCTHSNSQIAHQNYYHTEIHASLIDIVALVEKKTYGS